MVDFECLSLDPTQKLEVFQQEIVFWQLLRKLDTVVTSTLRNPCDGLHVLNENRENEYRSYRYLNLLDLIIIWRRDTVKVGSNLCAKIRRRNEST